MSTRSDRELIEREQRDRENARKPPRPLPSPESLNYESGARAGLTVGSSATDQEPGVLSADFKDELTRVIKLNKSAKKFVIASILSSL